MSELHCPNCNHHIGTLTTPSDSQSGNSVVEDVLPRVREWLSSQVGRGRVEAADLHRQFMQQTSVDISPRSFGIAMREAGASSRRSGSVRYWQV